MTMFDCEICPIMAAKQSTQIKEHIEHSRVSVRTKDLCLETLTGLFVNAGNELGTTMSLLVSSASNPSTAYYEYFFLFIGFPLSSSLSNFALSSTLEVGRV